MKTWLKSGIQVKCTPLIGIGKAFASKAGVDGTIRFELPEKNSYALYKYVIN